MKTTTSSIIRIDENGNGIVTKAFQKKASIYGTEEFKLWREFKAEFTNAVMLTKEIKKNPNKKTSTKNMTYENMALFIKENDNAEALMAEFKSIYNKSKVQANPYRYVLAWFMQKFEDHNSYMEYFESLAMANKAEADIFAM